MANAPPRGLASLLEDPRAAIAAALLCALASACAAAAPTRLHVVVTAGPVVQERMSSVRLRVMGGRAPDSTEIAETRASHAIEWPAEAWIVPRDGDASRPVRIEVEALGPTGQTIARVGTSTSFLAGETRTVRLHVDDGCLGAATCEVVPPCSGGECADAGDRSGDAGAASRRDASAPRDARSCSMESCDGTIDDDCDGRVDEGCECVDGARRACPGASDEGECRAGTQSCVDGRWRGCEGGRSAAAEECNARDDDCDGRSDEELTRRCGRGGDCSQDCHDGDWDDCEGDCRDDD